MNKTKLARRTALAAKIRDRYNPPQTRPAYKVHHADNGHTRYADTRDEARIAKREFGAGAWIERRTDAGTYERIR